jgi:hypothetical protein
VKEQKTRSHGCEVENRDGDRRSYAMSISDSCQPFRCTNLAVLETKVDMNRASTLEALKLADKNLGEKIDDLQALRKEVVSDRYQYFLKTTHDFYADSVDKEIKEIKKVIDRNSERLIILETTFLTRIEAEKLIDGLREFHENDLKVVKKQIDGFNRLVWVGLGVAIAVQVIFHFYFLKS